MEIIRGLKFPLEDLDWGKKILIGGVLNTVPILNFISFGYALETMKMVMDKDYALPDWDEFGAKFMMGLKAVIISIIYMIIPIVIMTISVIIGLFFGKESIAMIGLSVATLLAVVIGVMLPMAIASYVAKDSMKVAFNFTEIIKRIMSVFVEYVIYYIVIVILMAIGSFLFVIPVIGWILGAICMFYLQLVSAYYFGMLYNKSEQS
jgi:uncharacterized membrane protein YdjX (TVP38/TMEM64 family)